MKTFFSLALVTIMSFTFAVSCTKEGPQGPAGNANVYHSNWFRPTSYQKDTVFGIWGFSHIQSAPQITQAILDSGTILTFAKLEGYNVSIWPVGQVGQLPITVTYVSGATQNDSWEAQARLGALRIRFENDHNYWSVIATQHQFRYIVIPSGANPRIRQMSYQEVCAMYGIPE